MQWIKPDFEEISLGMEATAYVNIDADGPAAEGDAPADSAASPNDDAEALE